MSTTKHKPSKRDTALVRKKDESEFENEDIIKVTRQFAIVMRRPLIYGMILILVGFGPWAIAYGYAYSWAAVAGWWFLGSIAFLFFYWLIVWVGWYFSVFVLTDKRIVVTKQKGFFTRSVSELALNNIQNVTYSVKGIQASLFHFGDIDIQTLSGSGGFDIKTVHHPEVFAKAIIRAAGLSGSTPTPQ